MITVNENEALEYLFSGFFKSDEAWCHPKRIMDSYEIIFMYEGTAYICEDGINYTLTKNDILFLEPGKEHYGFQSSDEFVSFSWIHYKTTCEKYKSLPKKCKASNPSALKTLFSQCFHTVNTPMYSPLCADLYIALIAEEILCEKSADSHPQSRLASQIKEHITLNKEKDLTVKEVASYFGYHENHVSRVFKASYSIALKDYIVSQRIYYAQALLNTTNYTVKQISQMLSFKSENHFVKFFQYHTKLSPTRYRNTYTAVHTNKS